MYVQCVHPLHCLLEIAPCSLKDIFIQELYLHETCVLQCAGACLWGLAVTDTLCPPPVPTPYSGEETTYTRLRNSLRRLVLQRSKGKCILWGYLGRELSPAVNWSTVAPLSLEAL